MNRLFTIVDQLIANEHETNEIEMKWHHIDQYELLDSTIRKNIDKVTHPSDQTRYIDCHTCITCYNGTHTVIAANSHTYIYYTVTQSVCQHATLFRLTDIDLFIIGYTILCCHHFHRGFFFSIDIHRRSLLRCACVCVRGLTRVHMHVSLYRSTFMLYSIYFTLLWRVVTSLIAHQLYEYEVWCINERKNTLASNSSV